MKEENQLSVEVAEADETRRMLNSWTLELANWLMSEVDMGRREAFTRADEHGVYVYFDLERKAFRAFAAWRLVEMKGMKVIDEVALTSVKEMKEMEAELIMLSLHFRFLCGRWVR